MNLATGNSSESWLIGWLNPSGMLGRDYCKTINQMIFDSKNHTTMIGYDRQNIPKIVASIKLHSFLLGGKLFLGPDLNAAPVPFSSTARSPV